MTSSLPKLYAKTSAIQPPNKKRHSDAISKYLKNDTCRNHQLPPQSNQLNYAYLKLLL